MAALRRSHLAHFLIVIACSSTDPVDGNGDVRGVDVLEHVDCHGQCFEQALEGASLAQGSVWVTRSKSLSSCNGNCTFSSVEDALVHADFGDAGATVLSTTPTFNQQMSAGVGVTPDGATIFFAHGDPTANHMVFDALATSGADAGHVTAGAAGRVVGVATDGRSAVFAIADAPASTDQFQWNSSDIGNWTGSGGSIDGDAGVAGSLYRVDFDDGGVQPQAATFDLLGSTHVFAFDATNVFGIGNGNVWKAPLDLSSAPASIATVDDSSQCGNGPCTSFSLPVGLAVANGVVAWEIMKADFVQGTPSYIKPTHCQIFTTVNPAQPIYDSTQGCMGLAIDATDAYFGVVEYRNSKTCCMQDGGLEDNNFIVTTSVGRVSLSKTSASAPDATLSWGDTTRFYGPRRLFVDANFVYGIDPEFVLRFAKTAFK